MKSSARTVGAATLGDICQALEEAARGADWDLVTQGFMSLAMAIDEVTDYVDRLG